MGAEDQGEKEWWGEQGRCRKLERREGKQEGRGLDNGHLVLQEIWFKGHTGWWELKLWS